MAVELMRTAEAQAAEVALDLSERVGRRTNSKGDGRGEGINGLDDGRLDVEGHRLSLSLLDSRFDVQRGLCLA